MPCVVQHHSFRLMVAWQVCCGAPKFDFLFIFTDCCGETKDACGRCCAKLAGCSKGASCDCSLAALMAKCNCCDEVSVKCKATCGPCIDTCGDLVAPTSKCCGRLVTFAYSIPLWTVVGLSPYLIVSFIFLTYTGMGCPSIIYQTALTICAATVNASLTGIRLHGGSEPGKIDFYYQMV